MLLELHVQEGPDAGRTAALDLTQVVSHRQPDKSADFSIGVSKHFCVFSSLTDSAVEHELKRLSQRTSEGFIKS